MRLAYVSDNGETLDISTALRQEPISVRRLLADAIFECQSSLPDTLDYLHTEQAIRVALLQFQGDQERYVRAYTLSRILDPRTQKTPRAQVIYQSFHHGGPLALIGIFYATLDAHRNIRSREILDFFLHKASEGSKLDLFARAGTLPCNASVTGWLHRILDKLELDSQVLACMLRLLGTVNIPKELFVRARSPSLTWGSDGNVTGVPPQVLPLIQEDRLFQAALHGLEHVGLASSTGQTISLHPKISDLLHVRLEDPKWVTETAKVVIHAFPKYNNVEPAVYVSCTAPAT